MNTIDWPSRRLSVAEAKAGAHALAPAALNEAERRVSKKAAMYSRMQASMLGGGEFAACKSASSACRGGRLPCPTPTVCRAVFADTAPIAAEASTEVGAETPGEERIRRGWWRPSAEEQRRSEAANVALSCVLGALCLVIWGGVLGRLFGIF